MLLHVLSDAESTLLWHRSLRLIQNFPTLPQVFDVEYAFDDPIPVAMRKYTDSITNLISPTKEGVEVDSFPWLLKVPVIREYYMRKFATARPLRKAWLDDQFEKKMVGAAI